MLNNVEVPFFKILTGKKVQNLIFGCSMDVKKNLLRTLQAILCKIKWTDFWGQIEPTYLLNG
jgi:hypothetical protein